ncbi:unnamed protein product [Paramecium octaurelia]|uniref:Uncharacterized protein n=1 Tax=Paramecium octaurelia TaxID=43137 RepID=A0A8S1VS40_PAROT|nr:unnamed protein product [Paramecium octaurelia]
MIYFKVNVTGTKRNSLSMCISQNSNYKQVECLRNAQNTLQYKQYSIFKNEVQRMLCGKGWIHPKLQQIFILICYQLHLTNNFIVDRSKGTSCLDGQPPIM